MNLLDPEDRAVACAEFVLGTLDEAERAQLIAALDDDESLQREVAFWQHRLLGLYRDIPAVEPSADVWRRVEETLDREPGRPSVASPAGPSATVRAKPVPRGKDMAVPLWKRLGFWQGLSGLAVAFALLLSLFVIVQTGDPRGPTYVAVLQTPDRQAAWLVKIGETGPVRIEPLSDRGAVPPGRAWQLWTKGKDASAPTSLGLLGAGPMEIARDALPYLGDDQLFEVSLEPEGGSTTGRPTGPILSLGATRRI